MATFHFVGIMFLLAITLANYDAFFVTNSVVAWKKTLTFDLTPFPFKIFDETPNEKTQTFWLNNNLCAVCMFGGI